MNLRKTTEWLLNASAEVHSDYFCLPVAGQEDPEYRERVYCYELYHRWRSKWSLDFPFSLGAEVDKSGHPIVRGNSKPDFLVHVPGSMNNLLVMEVKPENADLSKIVEDLRKLTQFRRNLSLSLGDSANYQAAYLWIYGLKVIDWETRLRPRLLQSINNIAEIDISLISCILHEFHGTKAKFVDWYDAP